MIQQLVAKGNNVNTRLSSGFYHNN